jgi:hypothetical protein
MWNAEQEPESHLTHDMPCQRCGHALHTFLACSDTCGCAGAEMPGTQGLLVVR